MKLIPFLIHAHSRLFRVLQSVELSAMLRLFHPSIQSIQFKFSFSSVILPAKPILFNPIQSDPSKLFLIFHPSCSIVVFPPHALPYLFYLPCLCSYPFYYVKTSNLFNPPPSCLRPTCLSLLAKANVTGLEYWMRMIFSDGWIRGPKSECSID